MNLDQLREGYIILQGFRLAHLARGPLNEGRVETWCGRTGDPEPATWSARTCTACQRAQHEAQK